MPRRSSPGKARTKEGTWADEPAERRGRTRAWHGPRKADHASARPSSGRGGHGPLYLYFPNKTALIAAVATAAQDMEQVLDGFFAEMDFTGMSAEARITAVGLRYIEFA